MTKVIQVSSNAAMITRWPFYGTVKYFHIEGQHSKILTAEAEAISFVTENAGSCKKKKVGL